MKDLKGTKTLENLMEAFAGESQARNKYTYYAAKAKKEGYEQIANLFLETAGNEKEHAELWFKLAHGVGTTEENLLDAAAGENYEWASMYKEMAEVAREEGFADIAFQMEGVAKIEKEHEERYRILAQNVKDGKVFEKDEDVVWQCSVCGHTYVGKKALEICPVCKHPKAFFQQKPENFK
jgi:rubrerythrin